MTYRELGRLAPCDRAIGRPTEQASREERTEDLATGRHPDHHPVRYPRSQPAPSEAVRPTASEFSLGSTMLYLLLLKISAGFGAGKRTPTAVGRVVTEHHFPRSGTGAPQARTYLR